MRFLPKTLLKLSKHISKIQTTTRNFCTINIFEPDYLEAMKSKLPLYDTLNIKLRGYDFCILENYQKYLHNLIRNMDINVEDSWAVPAQEMQVNTLKPNSEVVQSEYRMKTYQRVVQVTDVTSLQLPILLRVLESSAPEGVNIEVAEHQEYDDEVRYIPDRELHTLKQTLEDLGGPSKKK